MKSDLLPQFALVDQLSYQQLPFFSRVSQVRLFPSIVVRYHWVCGTWILSLSEGFPCKISHIALARMDGVRMHHHHHHTW